MTLTGVQGEAVPGQSVSIIVTGPALAGPVRDNGNGTYTAKITATRKAGHATLTGTDTSVRPSVSGVTQLKLTAVPKHPHHPQHPKTCTVPKLAGDTLAAAKAALRRARCGVKKIVTRKSVKVKKGRVISTNPKAGKRFKKGTRVTIVVSTGSRAPKVLCRVPKLKGDTLAAARRALGRAHCAAGKVTRKKSAKVAKGRVISSSPKAGKRFKKGTRVTIVVSTGSRAPKVLCRVPKLKGDTLAAARRALGRAHCAAGKVTRKKSAKVAKGRVISSSPGVGSKHKSGTRVNLNVSRADTERPPGALLQLDGLCLDGAAPPRLECGCCHR